MSAEPFQDVPKLLRDPAACDARRLQLTQPHIAPLSEFLQRLRATVRSGIIPEFNPWDGGTDAEVLYLLEAPGPKACLSGFVSRNNPDETAKNFLELNIEAGIPRKRTICWNVIPWYIGSGTNIRAANSNDLRSGIPPFFDLLKLLPKLRVVVLVGRKAEYITKHLERRRPDLKVFRTPHPSPMYYNRAVGNRQNILSALHHVADFLAMLPPIAVAQS